MIVAISSTGDMPEAPVDVRFGRCFCFVLYDTESGGRTFEPNPYRTTGEDAALKAAQMLLDRGVRRVFAGQFGTRVEEFFLKRGVQMVALTRPFVVADILTMIAKRREASVHEGDRDMREEKQSMFKESENTGKR